MAELTHLEKSQGWELLFDGRTLTGWASVHEEHGWAVKDGALVAVKPLGGRYLHTVEQFSDFILSLEFNLDPGTNSGVFLRWSDLNDPVNTGLEVQIYDRDDTDSPNAHSCGAIYDLVAPTRYVAKKAGEWNKLVVHCVGPFISVVLNGEAVAVMDVTRWNVPGKNPDGQPNKFRYAWSELPRTGHIGLQNYGANKGEVRYRNIKLKRLG